MLAHLDIRDFALIEHLALDFEPGLTVLTGETGAGKSILIEALGLALGDRADSGVVRDGAARSTVSATVTLGDNVPARRWLEEQALDDGDECLLRRVIGADGRSRAFINGSPVPAASLRALGILLVDIHGQHAHHALLGQDHQLALLDGYARHPDLLARVADCHEEWRRLAQEAGTLEELLAGEGGGADLLRYQAGELDALALAEGEVEALDAEHRRLAHAGELIEACQDALGALEDDDEALGARIARLTALLRPRADVDPGIAGAVELLEAAGVQLDEAAGELRVSLDRLDLDPERLEQIDRRLGAIHDLARKHRVAPAGLPALHAALGTRLADLEGADARLAALREEIAHASAAWGLAADALGEGRNRAARRLGKAVTQEMRRLGMPEARFSIDFEARSADRPSPLGRERARFLVSTNPGQPPRPLARVASGGELSRMGLAIQMITVEQTAVPIAVFDEVDVGIGGRVAEIVGQGLRALGGRRQVLCVTHQPQVAALGHHHLRVMKALRGGTPAVTVAPLSREARTEEIARMLGGVEISATTRAHAEEMIGRSGQLASDPA